MLQPRVTPSLPIGREGSFFQRMFSSTAGIDPYAAAVSDVYQDLLGEGSYAGKGIYDIDAFEAALADRVPEGTLLSHDLFEGIFARAGLASDIEVVEEFPSRYDVAAVRQHRWARGDWQLLPWILGRRDAAADGRGQGAVPLIGLWKMLDNLRRSLSAPASVAALAYGWTAAAECRADLDRLRHGGVGAAYRRFRYLPLSCPGAPAYGAQSFARAAYGSRAGVFTDRLLTTFLAHQAWLMIDAIGRTLFRLFVSHRKLLEWVTAAQAQSAARSDLRSLYRRMTGGLFVRCSLRPRCCFSGTHDGWVAAPFLLIWLAAPLDRLDVSAPRWSPGVCRCTLADARSLRLVARRTWRFFEKFVTADDHMLPPDNFQEDPHPVLAHRTSPTNMGLYLLSVVAARDFGWIGTIDTVERLEATLATMGRLQRYRGHFFNWYDTRDLRPLDPRYVSSVDSGNLAAHLIALASACR